MPTKFAHHENILCSNIRNCRLGVSCVLFLHYSTIKKLNNNNNNVDLLFYGKSHDPKNHHKNIWLNRGGSELTMKKVTQQKKLSFGSEFFFVGRKPDLVLK